MQIRKHLRPSVTRKLQPFSFFEWWFLFQKCSFKGSAGFRLAPKQDDSPSHPLRTRPNIHSRLPHFTSQQQLLHACMQTNKQQQLLQPLQQFSLRSRFGYLGWRARLENGRNYPCSPRNFPCRASVSEDVFIESQRRMKSSDAEPLGAGGRPSDASFVRAVRAFPSRVKAKARMYRRLHQNQTQRRLRPSVCLTAEPGHWLTDPLLQPNYYFQREGEKEESAQSQQGLSSIWTQLASPPPMTVSALLQRTSIHANGGFEMKFAWK